MRALLVGVLLVVALQGTAEAGWKDLPVVSHSIKIVGCILADSGKIVNSAVKNTSDFAIDVVKVTADCLKFIIETGIPNHPA